VHGALLIGIWLMSCTSWLLRFSEVPETIFSTPRFDAALAVDFSGWAPGSGKLQGLLVGSIVLLFVALFDLAGVQYGLLGIAGLLRNGKVPRSSSIFSSAALSTMVGSLLGTSPIIIANESSAGIVEGGRTGFCAVVVAVLFALSAFLAPLLAAVPPEATAVPLVLTGAFMMSPVRGINWDNLRAAIPSFLTLTVVPFTYSIHTGILAGILVDAFLALATGRREEPKSSSSPGDEPGMGEKRKSANNFGGLASPAGISTPHATLASAALKNAEKTETAQQLQAMVGPCAARSMGAVEDCAEQAREEALFRALEAYLEGR